MNDDDSTKPYLWQAAATTVSVTAERAQRLKAMGEAVWPKVRLAPPEQPNDPTRPS